MTFAGINVFAVLCAAIASFVFGGVWYGVLAKQWMAAVGKSEAEIKSSGRSLPMLLVLTFLAQIVMAVMLAGVIGHLGADQVTLRNGLISGFFIWFGFVLTSLVVNHGYQGTSWALARIDGGHWLGVLLIQGAVIGYLGLG